MAWVPLLRNFFIALHECMQDEPVPNVERQFYYEIEEGKVMCVLFLSCSSIVLFVPQLFLFTDHVRSASLL
jgi:hypothetical protein